MTHQRRVILDEIKGSASHPTADEIYERVKKKLPRISLGTVYRNLDILASIGAITRLDSSQPPMRFEWNTREHYHITCVECGAIEDAPFEPSDDSLLNVENALGNLTKFGIFGHKLEFVGLCSRCRAEGQEWVQPKTDL
jgi:Fur family ferric uptake transcriptional regulator